MTDTYKDRVPSSSGTSLSSEAADEMPVEGILIRSLSHVDWES